VEFYSLASRTARRLSKWEESIRSGERAIELDPQNHELAVTLAQTYNGLRRHDEANRVIDAAISRARGASIPRLAIAKHVAAIGVGDLGAARRALDAFPDWDAMDYEYSRTWLCILERDFARARRTAEKAEGAFRDVPNFWLIRATIAKGEGKAEEARKANEEAKRVAEQIVSKRPDDPEMLGQLAIATARLGQREEALVLVRRAIAICPPGGDALLGPTCQMQLAEVLTLTGDRDAAFKILEGAIRMPYATNYGELKFDPSFDVLRDDPRFEQLLAESRTPL
jgi:tetratricopeptide (TPR) repeat protein